VRSLTGAHKGVEDKVVLLDPGVVGHDERQAGVHAGVTDEVAILHTVGSDQVSLAVSYLVMSHQTYRIESLSVRK